MATPADRLLYEGLPRLNPALRALGDGALLVGGLATAAWLAVRPMGLPIRATRDVDLGIDRAALGITRERAVVRPLLVEHDFAPGYGGEPFRFALETEPGDFVVDLLMAKGASRAEPPLLEPGLSSLAAPGLRYALDRGPVPLELVLVGEETRSFQLFTIQLDAAFVMKAALVADGVRLRRDRRVTDTADAIMLAAACAQDEDAMVALAASRTRSEPKRAIRWLSESLASPRSAPARRLVDHTGDPARGEWAVQVAKRFASALDAC